MGLVVGRRLNETVCIGDDIRVTVVRIQFDRVRLHIEAPKDVPVDREEVAANVAKNGRKRKHEQPGTLRNAPHEPAPPPHDAAEEVEPV